MKYIILIRRALLSSFFMAVFLFLGSQNVFAAAPMAPIDLLVDGEINNIYIATRTPSFSAVYNDSEGDDAAYYRIQVSSNYVDWNSLVWDSAKSTIISELNSGERNEDIRYLGNELIFNKKKYHWRIKFWNENDEEGEWSSGEEYFIMASSTTEKFYSLPGDGYVSGVHASEWNSIHSAASGIYDNISSYKQFKCLWDGHNNEYKIIRMFFPFNLENIDKTKIIISSFNFRININEDVGIVYNYDDDYIGIVKTTQDNVDVLVGSDYSKCGDVTNPQTGGEVDVSSVKNNQYTSIMLNNNGLKWVKEDGYTKLGMRFGNDIENTPPTGKNVINVINFFESSYADYRPYLEVTYLLPPDEEPEGPEPVIVVPGILGSWVYKGEWQIDPILKTYDNLIEAIDNTTEYDLGVNLFTFPYDWRRSNADTAIKLNEKINQVLASTSRDKVDLVAHSMGGLVSRQYIASSDYDDNVDQLILLGSPHVGATESYLAYEGAQFSGILSKVKSYVLGAEALRNGYINKVSFIQIEIPSVGELLPVYNYLYRKIDGTWELGDYPLGHPSNIFLENLNKEDELHYLRDNVEVVNIYSVEEKQKTLDYLRVRPYNNPFSTKWTDGIPVKKIKGYGDGTVPLRSLESLSGANAIEIEGPSHTEIVTEAQGHVIFSLLGEYYGMQISSPWGEVDKLMFARVYSPVDFLLETPEIGNNLLGNLPNGEDVTQLPNGFYTGSEVEDEFATIINPSIGWYTLYVKGRQSGIYGIAVDILTHNDESDDDEDVVRGIIGESQIDIYRFYYDGVNIGPLMLYKQIDLDDLIDDIDDLFAGDELFDHSAYKVLRNKFRQLVREYDRWQNENKQEKIIALEKQINNTVANIKKHLDRLLAQKKISEILFEIFWFSANNILHNID